MEDRIPTPGQEGRVFITPEDGSPPYHAVLTMADNPTQEGTPLNKETLLQDSTEVAIFGNANNRTVDEAFSGVIAHIWKLIDVLDGSSSMSGEWVVPDFFGDGQPYDLGVYMIGGGGSGCAAWGADIDKSYYAFGGFSGVGKNFILKNVSPGTEYAYVIGQGGLSVFSEVDSATGSHSTSGNNGGTTSFGEETAEGGSGGDFINYDPVGIGGQPVSGPDVDISDVFGSISGVNSASFTPPSRIGQNQFDTTMVSLCAGGKAGPAGAQTINAMPDGTKGGSGKYARNASVQGESATGHGNGGGGAYVRQTRASLMVTSGAGSNGIIFLYAGRRLEHTSENS